MYRAPQTCLARLILAIGLLAALLVIPAKSAWAGPKYAAIVIDAQTGYVLHAHDPDGLRHPASLTKLMTLFMIFEAMDQRRIGFDTRWRISAEAASQDPTKLGLQAGQTIGVREVVLGLITKSANDAAVVAAEGLAGDEDTFALRMTQRARRLGMSRTTFKNASGLPDPGQFTSAADMAKLARAIMRSFPQHYPLFSTTHFTYGGITHQSHNRFMDWYDGADGLKTGYIRASGFNLAASATRNGRRLIGVVLGGQSPGWRDDRMGELLDASFARRAPSRSLPEIQQASAPAPMRTPTQPVTLASAPVLTPPPVSAAPAQPSAANGQTGITLTAPPAAARNTASRAPAPRPGWSIQVGAFADVGQARRAAEAAKRLAPTALRSAAIDVQRVGGSGKDADLLRARLSGLEPNSARDACRILLQRRQGCFPVAPAAGLQGVAANVTR